MGRPLTFVVVRINQSTDVAGSPAGVIQPLNSVCATSPRPTVDEVSDKGD